MVDAAKTRSAPLRQGSYSQGVKAGNLLFVSGQLPLNSRGHLTAQTISHEATQALTNVQAIVEAAGRKLANIVQCTIYVSAIAYWEDVNQVYNKFFRGVPVLPARAVLPIKELHYGAHIEIQAVAVLA